jgi:hypothetical protein
MASPAAAQRWLDSSVSATGISGYDDRFDADIKADSRYALYGLQWSESGDKPCRLVLLARNIEDGNDTRTASYQFDICGGAWNPARYVPSVPTDFESAPPTPGFTLGEAPTLKVEFSRPRFFVRGIKACANRGNHRLKGIQLNAGRIRKPSWQVDPPNAEQSEKRPNCGNRDWHNQRFCPDGKVAIGARVHHDTLFITGLELLCARVVP